MAGRPFPFGDKEFASDLPSNAESSDITSSTSRIRSSGNPNSSDYSPSSSYQSTGSSHGAHYSSLNPNSPYAYEPNHSNQETRLYSSYTARREEHAHKQQERVDSTSASETYHSKLETRLYSSSRKSDTAPRVAEEHAHEQQEFEASSDHDLFDINAAYRGVFFSKQKQTKNIPSEGGTIIGEGITLSVPHGAVPASGSVDMSLQACLDGPFYLPGNLEFVSPVYLIESHFHFRKKVTLSITMFLEAQPKDFENIVFVSSPAVNIQESSYWNFQVSNASPRFREGSRIGEVELTHFCFGAFARKIRGWFVIC